MKTILIILTILSCSSGSFSQSYHRLVNPGNKWNYLDQRFTTCKGKDSGINSSDYLDQASPKCGNGGEARTYSLYLSDDTIIDGVIYAKVLCDIIRYDGTKIVYAGAIREDTIKQMVFIKLPDQEERLIYSFNVEVGDIISIDTTYYKDAVIIRSIKSIGDFDFNGFAGKKITICDSIKRINSSMTPFESIIDTWYEGIGSFKCIFDLQHLGTLSNEMELLCFWNHENQIYGNPGWTVCEYAIFVGIEEMEKESEINVYPIPANQLLRIDTNQPIEKIELLNLNGKVVVITNVSNLDLSEISNGFYILRIYFESGMIATRKIIKNAKE